MSSKPHIKSLVSIVAVDRHGAIGCDNSLPWRLRSDMAFFRQKTLGNSVIMGRKTYDSVGGKPLPGRNNIVLSHNGILFPSTPTCKLVNSVDEALFRAFDFDDDTVFIIGGAQTYDQFDGIVDGYLVTIVDHEVPNADAYLPDNVAGSIKNWQKTELARVAAQEGQDDHNFVIYHVEAPDPEKRATARASLIEAFSEKVAEVKRKKIPGHKSSPGTSQVAFAF